MDDVAAAPELIPAPPVFTLAAPEEDFDPVDEAADPDEDDVAEELDPPLPVDEADAELDELVAGIGVFAVATLGVGVGAEVVVAAGAKPIFSASKSKTV